MYGRFFLVSKMDPFFFEERVYWFGCFTLRRARHPGPGKRIFTPGQLSVEFVNVGGWLTSGDMALDSLCSVPGGS